MLNLAEYRNRPAGLADFLPWAALVEEGVVLNKDGSFQRTARFPRTGPRQRHAGRAGRRHRAPQQCAAPSRLRLGDLRRGAADRGPDLSAFDLFPKPAVGAGRSRTAGRVRGSGRAFREPLLPDLRLVATCRRCLPHREAGSTKGRCPDRRRSLGTDARLRRSDQTGAATGRRLHARGRRGSMTARR